MTTTDRDRSWRLLEVSTDDPARNLAIDEALIRSRDAGESPPTLRLWCNPPCVVIGISQNPFEEVDLAACSALNLPVVRRQSGGGAVYHDGGNLNYSLVVDHAALLGHTATTQSYVFLLKAVIAALGALGVEATQRNISDVYVGEQKIAGCAQYRTSRTILHHGCVLVDSDLIRLERTLRVPAAWFREVVNLVAVATPCPGMADVGVAIAKAYAAHFDVTFQHGELSAREWERVEELYAEKYCQREWHYRIPPGWKPGRYGPHRLAASGSAMDRGSGS